MAPGPVLGSIPMDRYWFGLCIFLPSSDLVVGIGRADVVLIADLVLGAGLTEIAKSLA